MTWLWYGYAMVTSWLSHGCLHRQLVLDLKRKVKENPNKPYFIRTGRIFEIDELDIIVYFLFNKIDIEYFWPLQ